MIQSPSPLDRQKPANPVSMRDTGREVGKVGRKIPLAQPKKNNLR